ncbi:MAG: NAD(P)-binding protein, partial [Clostridia bacterium]|nr:NAD(P)-binding protein [Clostridia bacterium]
MDQKTMRELEAKCIQESPPGCTAACPVHVDARALIAAVQKEDFEAGIKILKRAVPFPGIISRICDEPCQAQCKRGEVGDPIAINALERACLEYGTVLESKLPPIIKKDKKVAVVGGGLSGLTVALELAIKGYKVVIYEKEGYLGGSIRDIPAEKLPSELIEADLAQIGQNPLIEVNFQTRVGCDGSPSLADLIQEFDAVYLGTGAGDESSLDLARDGQGGLILDPLTFQTSRPKVFAGGTLVLGVADKSPITSISHGK